MSRPDLKIFLRSIDGGAYVDLLAYWRGDDGMLRGVFDREIAEIAIKRKDGTIVRIRPDEKGRASDYYINAREGSAQQRSAPRSAPTRSQIDHAKTPASRSVVGEDDDYPF